MKDNTMQRLAPAVAEAPLLAGLMRGELIEWVNQLQGIFDRLEQMRSEGLLPATLAGMQVFNTASRQTTELASKIEALASLAEVFSHGTESNRERFFLHGLLNEVVGSSSANPSSRFVIREPDANIAPVYGNKHLLRMLLAHLLRELDASTPVEQKIVLTLRQLGNHMFLSSHPEALLPTDKRSKPHSLPPSMEGMTFSLCRRIAELHGGTLRLESEAGRKGQELMHFTISLPTCKQAEAPNERQCTDCPLTAQIERYATDLAELIDRCHELEKERIPDGQAADRR